MALGGASIAGGRSSGSSRPGSAHLSPSPSPLTRQLPLPSSMTPPGPGSVSGRSSSASSHAPSPAQTPVQGLYAPPAKPSAVHDTAAAAAWSKPTESVVSSDDASILRSDRAAYVANMASMGGALSGAGPSRLPQSSRPSMRSRPPSSTAGSRSTSASASLLHLPMSHHLTGVAQAAGAVGPSGVSTPGSVSMSPTTTSNQMSGGQQSLASASRIASGAASRSSSPPPASDASTPSHTTKSASSKRHQVTETNHLQLQTHQSGRRMINQYIIEDELGRGVHGKVRLAFDTETNERVAVKIVEREGKKRLGQGAGGWNARAAKERPRTGERADSDGHKGKWRDSGASQRGGVDAAELRAGLTRAADSGPRAHFAPSPEPPRSPGGHSGGPSRQSAAAERESEKQRLKDQRDKARKQLLWTTDKKVKREIAIMKKCAHENVVRLREVIDDPQSKKIFMVLEYMAGGEVVWKDERGFPTLTIEEARRTIRDVVLGLEYLHYQGIIHRDIKPANLLWDENRRVKISDFGVSHFSYALLVASGGLPSIDSDNEERARDPSLMDDHELAKTAGSPAFFAPELCMAGDAAATTNSERRSSRTLRTPVGEPSRKEFPFDGRAPSTGSGTPGASTPPTATIKKPRPPVTKAIDVWALGVTLYCLLFGHTPFTADNEFALFAVIPNEDYELPAFAGADRMRIGPRRRRWRTLPMWTDEEGDVNADEDLEGEPDADPRTLSEDARLLRDLLDRLLEKDPAKRIKLEEVKQHAWVLRDLEDAPAWLNDTDPAQHPFVEVTHEEVEDALTGFSKIKRRIRRWQLKLLEALAGGARRPRSKSASHAVTPPFGIMRMTPGNGAGVQSGVTSESTSQQTSPLASPHSDEKRHRVPRPHFLFRRQHTVDGGGEADSKSLRSLKPLSKLGSTLTPGRPSTAGMISSRNQDGTRSQPASRPPSPGGGPDSMGLSTPLTAGATPRLAPADAVSMLRQISSHHGASERSHAAAPTTAATMSSATSTPSRAPLFQRRSTSRSSRTLDGRVQRSSIDMRRPDAEKIEHIFARPSEVNAGRAPPSRSGSSVLSRDFDAVSRPTTASSEHDKIWQQHNMLGSRSPSLHQRPPSRHRLGDLFRGVFLGPGGDHGVRRQGLGLGSRPGTANAQDSAAPLPASGGTQPSSPVIVQAPEARAAPQLKLDTHGAAAAVGPLSAPGVPASAPVSRLTIGAAFGGQVPEPRAYSRPSSPHFRARDGFSPDGLRPTQDGPGHVELDDVDLDLELSDDDLDEDGRDPNRTNSFLRNDGKGWILHSSGGGGDTIEASGIHHLSAGLRGSAAGMRRGPSASARSMSPGASTSGSHAASPMYSEEGGASGSSESEHHLVIKTIARGNGGAASKNAPGLTSIPLEAPTHNTAALDLDPIESRHAAALRRGSIVEEQHEVPFTASRIAPSVYVSGVAGAVHAEHLSPSGSVNVGDLSTASRFADADESRKSLSPSASAGGLSSPLLGGAPSSDRTERPNISDLDYSPREDLADADGALDDSANGSGDQDDAEDSGDDEESCFSFSAGRRSARPPTAGAVAGAA